LGILAMGLSGICELKQKLFPIWKKFLFYFSQNIIVVGVLTDSRLFATIFSHVDVLLALFFN